MPAPYTKLDANQVLKHAFDEAEDRLRVDATVSASIGDVTVVDGTSGDQQKVNADGSTDVNIVSPIEIAIDASTDSIAIGQGANRLTVNPDGTANVRMSNSLITAPFDYIAIAYPSSTVETYSYKLGGVSGTLVGVVTVAYVDSSKEQLVSVAKS